MKGNFHMSYTLFKMCFAYEVNAVMECGKHGGSQRWQLTIIHLSFGERKLYTKEVEPCRNAGLLLYEGKMEIIQECAQNFKRLSLTTKYVFHTSLSKQISVLNIDFQETDFHHAVGLQYLHDIDIPKNKKKVIPWILDEKNPITDDYLERDSNYKGANNQERDVELRISEFTYLEDYLDTDNIVYIFSPKDSPYKNSIIDCDYIIKSQLKSRNQTVFIFLRYRAGINSPLKIASFGVKKNVEYGGIYQYVMLKDKIVNGVRTNIFKHCRYTKDNILLAEPDIIASYVDSLD